MSSGALSDFSLGFIDQMADDQADSAFVETPRGPARTRSTGGKSRNWVFTINNPTEHPIFMENMRYLVYQLEVGANGTPHYQGFVQFKHAVAMRTAKNCIGQNAHVEQAASPARAREYAMKEATREEGPWEHGEWLAPAPGRRTDLEAAVEMVRAHGLRRVAEEMPAVFVRNHRGLAALQAITAGYRTEPPKILVLYGPTGCGKSYTARKMMPQIPDTDLPDMDQHWVWDPSLGKWFQGYTGQKYVIFEEFRGQLTFGQMLSLLDRYTCHVEYKGGSTNWVASRIVITSPVHPRMWYESLASNDGQMDQLMRRLTSNGSKIVELTQLNGWYGNNVPEIEGW